MLTDEFKLSALRKDCPWVTVEAVPHSDYERTIWTITGKNGIVISCQIREPGLTRACDAFRSVYNRAVRAGIIKRPK